MKNARMKTLFRIVCFVSLNLFSVTLLFAQDGFHKQPNVFINSNCNGYLEYLPIGYSTHPSQKYPLLIYLNGLGSTGDGSSAALENEFSGGNYPHEQQRGGSWPDAFTVNNQTFQFVTITPQFVLPFVGDPSTGARMPKPAEIDDVINFVINHYQIDTTRIYLMGSSQGGGMVWEYTGESPVYARRIAAMIPFSGVSFPVEERANIIKHSRVPVWAFAGRWDNALTGVPSYFTMDYVEYINQDPAPTVPARETLFPTSEHLIWPGVLNPNYTEGGINIYQWLLLHQRQVSSAHAGFYQELILPTNSVQLHGYGTGPNGTVGSISWQKISGPDGGNFSNAAILNPTVTNLHAGNYVFRLTIRDNASALATDEVEVFVNPSRQNIEAENFVAMQGFVQSTTVDPNLDGSPGIRENGIDVGDWGDYMVNVPLAGNYKFKFRLGSFNGSELFQVKNASGAVLADSIPVFFAGGANNNAGWDSSFTVTRVIPLAAGNQKIRIESLGNGVPGQVWYLNWFQVENTPVSSSTILPVNFTLFNAQCVTGGVRLQWKTAGELSSKNFSIEKSNNGRDWETLTTLPAAGNTGVEQSYTYTDASTSGTYYRIVQQDFNGRKTLSPIIRSSCSEKNNFGVYPNPVADRTYVHINLQQATRVDLSVLDSKGAEVQHLVQSLPAGNSQIPVDLNGLPAGSYTLYAKWNEQSHSMKLVKKN